MSTDLVPGESAASLPFTYAEFSNWYESHCARSLEPARLALVRLLQEQLEKGVSELDRHRIRVGASRVKKPLRVWAKLQKPKYDGLITDMESIPAHIDDLVGVRIVCNNHADLAAVQGMLTGLPTSAEAASFGLAAEPGSQRLYMDSPKPSGYRAFHINLVTPVAALSGVSHVRGEVQVRTLLQDGWGELTHEDTYKPGVELPPLVITLSRRMADLLATVDDLAQDLRQELDRLAQSAVDDAGSPPMGTPSVLAPEAPSAAGEVDPALVLDEAERIVRDLRQPASLASIAARLQGTFGTSVRRRWAGYGSFKALLVAAVPDVNIVNVGPGYVVPVGAQPSNTWPTALLDVLP